MNIYVGKLSREGLAVSWRSADSAGLDNEVWNAVQVKLDKLWAALRKD